MLSFSLATQLAPAPPSPMPQNAPQCRGSEKVVFHQTNPPPPPPQSTSPHLPSYNSSGPMDYSPLQLLHSIPIAVIDTETTGASAAYGHKVIEVGIIRMEN